MKKYEVHYTYIDVTDRDGIQMNGTMPVLAECAENAMLDAKFELRRYEHIDFAITDCFEV